MAPATAFSSLDGTSLDGGHEDVHTTENGLARRSISIFSRRGIEDQPHLPRPFIAQATTRTPRQMTERQKSWLRRRSTPVLGSSPQKPRGTVLNAVPAAQTIRMTAMEEEMATSPNEEIVSAMESPSTPRPASASPTTPSSGMWMRKDWSPKRTTSKKRKATNSKIGVWANGVAHWEDTARSESSFGHEEPSLQEIGFAPLHRQAEQLNPQPNDRPQLSVLIPGSRSLSFNDTTISTVVCDSEMPPRSWASVAPAKRVSKFLAPESITQSLSHTVSPLENATAGNAPHLVIEDEDGTRKDAWRSSSSENSLAERDDRSSHSRRSSATSIDLQLSVEHETETVDSYPESESRASSINSSIAISNIGKIQIRMANVDKPLPPVPPSEETPQPSPVQSAEPPPELLILRSPVLASGIRSLGRTSISVSQSPARLEMGPSLQHARSTRSEPSRRRSGARKSWRKIELQQRGSASNRASHYLLSASAPTSPTLSEAEQDLETELSLISDHAEALQPPGKQESIRRGSSMHSVMHPPKRAPTVPRRSRKRDWRLVRNIEHAAVGPATARPPRRRKSEAALRHPSDLARCNSETRRPLRKSCSALELHKVSKLTTTSSPPSSSQEISTLPQVAYEDGLIVLEDPVTFQKVMDDAVLTVSSAEEVLLHILEALSSAADLFNTALINKGMYRVYRENEVHLIRTVTRNSSPAAAELREWSPPNVESTSPGSAGSSQLEHSPLSYMRGHRRDHGVIERLKELVLERCQTFIRRETAFAISSSRHPDSQRFDDAFFRIWSFCKIFGSNRGREEDVTGQLDWLKGGLLANSSDLSATMNMNLEYEMGSVLLNPPDHFAIGNPGGLTAGQLYDMTEIWGCLTYLLQPYQGQTRQAMRCGVFDNCEVFEGDTDREEYLLEEWTAYILTLGPAVVLELATLGGEDNAYGFALAKVNGWTDWTPPQYGGSRTSFLKEPVSRIYEERVSAAALSLRNPAEREKKEMSRKRVATLAAEIRLARQSSTYKRLPLIDQAHEKAMSVLTRQGSSASTFSFHGPAASPLTRSASVRASSAASSRAPHFSTPRPLEPKTLVHSQRHHRRTISPIIEDKVQTFNRLSALQIGLGGVVPDTAESAIKRITEMGFTRREAQQALRATDRGDGLCLDRAVEVLLKGMP